MKTKAIPIVAIALIWICFFPPIVSTETVVAWNEKACNYIVSGDYERAIGCFDKAIELDPNSAATYSNRGIAYYYLNQYESAIEDCSRAIELDPNDYWAYNNLVTRGILLEKRDENKYGLYITNLGFRHLNFYYYLSVLNLIRKNQGIDFELFLSVSQSRQVSGWINYVTSILFEIAYENNDFEAIERVSKKTKRN